MFRTLRNRLILSHILPALIIIPLMGAAMVYVLEPRFLLPNIYSNLAKEAELMAELTRNQPIFWQDRQAAELLVEGVTPYLNGKISLVTWNGRLLATSDVTEDLDMNRLIELPDLNNVHQGQVVQLQNGPLAEAITP